MAEVWLKLRMLWLYNFNLAEWHRDVWTQDAAERMCCDGRECGCYGDDYWSHWELLLKDKEPTP